MPSGLGAEIIKEIFKIDSGFPLLDERFRASVGGFLVSNHYIAYPTRIGAVLGWITPSMIQKVSESARNRLRQHISNRLCGGELLMEEDLRRLQQLPIFKSVVANPIDSAQPFKYLSF
jgi:hypothetical protein